MTRYSTNDNDGNTIAARTIMVSLVLIAIVSFYLLLANIVFLWQLNDHIPPACRDDNIGRKCWRLQELARIVYVLSMVSFTCWLIYQCRIENGWIVENLADYPCKQTIRWAELFYTNGLTTFIRLVYAYARCVLMKRSLNQKTRVSPFAIILTALLGLTGLNQWLMVPKVIEGVCVYEITSTLRVTWVVLIISFEGTSFWLYYKPLWDADIKSGIEIYVYSKFKETKSTGQRSNQYFGMKASESRVNFNMDNIVRDSLTEARSADKYRVSRKKTAMVQNFHRSVVRNFYAGLVCIVTSIAWNVVYYFLDENV